MKTRTTVSILTIAALTLAVSSAFVQERQQQQHGARPQDRAQVERGEEVAQPDPGTDQRRDRTIHRLYIGDRDRQKKALIDLAFLFSPQAQCECKLPANRQGR